MKTLLGFTLTLMMLFAHTNLSAQEQQSDSSTEPINKNRLQGKTTTPDLEAEATALSQLKKIPPRPQDENAKSNPATSKSNVPQPITEQATTVSEAEASKSNFDKKIPPRPQAEKQKGNLPGTNQQNRKKSNK